MKRPNLRTIGIEEGEESQLKDQNQYYKGKIFYYEEEVAYKSSRSMKNTKYIGAEKKVPSVHNNQNTKHMANRKNIESYNAKMSSEI